MSGSTYIDGDERAENDEAKRQGVPVARIAELRHMEVSELCQLMGWPVAEEIPTAGTVEQPEDYLWAADRLDAVL